MRRKTREDPTTQKHQKIFPHAQAAGNNAYRIECALLADGMAAGRSNRVKHRLSIGIDLMGSDYAPDAFLNAAAALLSSLPENVILVAIGTSDYAKKATSLGLEFLEAREVIEMGENPLSALRRKKQSSIAKGLRKVKEGSLNGFVSSGNTGALVSASKIILGTFAGLSRPALLALMPTKKKPVAVLDVGAHLHVKASQLIEYAFLGTAYQRARGIEHPKTGLLNIGAEASKGTSELRLAYKALANWPSFSGNVEGTSVFNGDVDVLVTDGFTGNIFLKTAEGIASLVLDRLQSQTQTGSLKHTHSRLLDLQKHLHYAEYPGALLAGVNGIVVKCHGYSTPEAFANGIRGAIEFAACGFAKSVKQQYEKNILEKEGLINYL